jgi:cyclophilin family peptidyl-prolyl cis-trans isomerase
MKNTSVIIIIFLAVLIFLGMFLYKGNDNQKTKVDTAGIIGTAKDINIDNINKNTNMDNNQIQNYKEAILHTNMGDITFTFASDKTNTTSNFIKLASSGFYNGVKFHRVIQGFMIQTGDPLSKDDSQKNAWGTGGPGYKFADELTGQEKYPTGTVAMANSGPNTNGSQFFIMTADVPLPPSYTVFGKVEVGQAVATKISEVKTDGSAQAGGHDRPMDDVIINSIELK